MSSFSELDPQIGLKLKRFITPEHPEVHYAQAEKGIKAWMTTIDHKKIGLMYLGSIAFFFFIGGLLALLLRLELWTPAKTFLDADSYNQVFTLHGAIMVFLVLVPSVPAALGNFFLPIMVGAKDVAFPRLNLFSFYIYLTGAIFAIFSIVSGAIDTGWTFYTPYSITSNTSVIPLTLGVFILGFSSILTGLNFIVTLHKLRVPGLTWGKLPLFCWSIYATSIIQILATPVLAITLLLLVMERFLSIGIFDPSLGGDPVLFQHFFWFYSHPAVYIMILPGFGIISEIIAIFSKKRIFGYWFIALSSMAIALIGFLVWGHHMFVSGQSTLASIVFSMISFFVGIPTGIKIFNWLATMYKGSISMKPPMWYAMSFLFLFSIGGFTGITLGTLSVDVHLHDTYYVVAHFHYVMMGGMLVAFLGGLHLWWPKMTGRMYNEKLANLSCLLIFVGFNMTFFTQFILGSKGMPRRYYNYVDQFQSLHQFSTVGTWVILAGFLIMAYYLFNSLGKNGVIAPKNPWNGRSLEWMTSTPPIMENFSYTPVVIHGPYDFHKPLAEFEYGIEGSDSLEHESHPSPSETSVNA